MKIFDTGPVAGTAADQFKLFKEPGCGGGATGEERCELMRGGRRARQTHK